MRGLAEKVDLREVLFEGEDWVFVESERWVSDEAWVGTLTLLGCGGDSKNGSLG